MAATQFPAHRLNHLPTLDAVDPATGERRTLHPVEAALRVETFGPLVVVYATYRFAPAAGDVRCRMTFSEPVRAYRACVDGEEAVLDSAAADLPTAGARGCHEGEAFELSWSGSPAGAPISLEVEWVQVAAQDGTGWSVRLPAAGRVAFLAHQAEESGGNGAGWRTEDEWLVAEGPLRPFMLYWWPSRDETQARLQLFACGDAGMAVLVPPRQGGPTLPRDVRVIVEVADAAQSLAQHVVQVIRAGLGERDDLHLAAGDDWQAAVRPGTPARCLQTLVITDGSGPRLEALLTAVPTVRVIGLRAAMPDAHHCLDPAASWSRNRADLEAFLAPLESVLAQDLVLKSSRGEVIGDLGDLGTLGLTWVTWRQGADVAGPYEVVGRDGQVGVQAKPQAIPHEAAWKAFEALIGPA
jgi:hypothetical protein